MLVQTSPPPQILPGCWQLLMQRNTPEADTQLAPATQSFGASHTLPTSIFVPFMSGISAEASSGVPMSDMSASAPISLGVGSKTPHPWTQIASTVNEAMRDVIDFRRMNKSAEVVVQGTPAS
jgi:hypothetical protein